MPAVNYFALYIVEIFWLPSVPYLKESSMAVFEDVTSI